MENCVPVRLAEKDTFLVLLLHQMFVNEERH